MTIDDDPELQKLQAEINHLLQLEKVPPLNSDGEFDFDIFHARLKARFALQEKYSAKKKALEESAAEQRRLAENVLSDKGTAEFIRIKQTYGAPADFDNRKINIRDILQAEKEIAACQGCTGLPCQKKYSWLWKETTTTINFDAKRKTFDIRRATCNYAKAQRKQTQIEKIQTFLKIPPEYEGKTFEDYQVDANNAYAVKAAKYLIEHPDKGAFFYGNVGTGKTFLAAIIAQEIIKRGRPVIFATVPEISMQLRSTFNRVPKRDSTSENLIEQPLTESEILDRLINVPTLILDDVGMEKPTRFVCSTFCNLFNERYNAHRQTILTSNYTLAQLERIFNNPIEGDVTLDGTRFYDRCKQMCSPVEFKGKSRRSRIE